MPITITIRITGLSRKPREIVVTEEHVNEPRKAATPSAEESAGATRQASKKEIQRRKRTRPAKYDHVGRIVEGVKQMLKNARRPSKEDRESAAQALRQHAELRRRGEPISPEWEAYLRALARRPTPGPPESTREFVEYKRLVEATIRQLTENY
jgi:hypothetical protein